MKNERKAGKPKWAWALSTMMVLLLVALSSPVMGAEPPSRYSSQINLSLMVPYHAAGSPDLTGEAGLQMIFDYWGPSVDQMDIRNVTKGPREDGVAMPEEIVRAAHFSATSVAASNPTQRGYSQRPTGYGGFINDWTNSQRNPSPRFVNRWTDLWEALSEGHIVMAYMYVDLPPVIDPQPPTPKIPDPTNFPPTNIDPPSPDPVVRPEDLAALEKTWRVIVGYTSTTMVIKDPWPSEGYASSKQGGRSEYSMSVIDFDKLWNITTIDANGIDTHRIAVTAAPFNIELELPTRERAEAGTVFRIAANITYDAPPFMSGSDLADPTATLALPDEYEFANSTSPIPLDLSAPRSYSTVEWDVMAPEKGYAGQDWTFELTAIGEVRSRDPIYVDRIGHVVTFDVQTYGFLNHPPVITSPRSEPSVIPNDGSIQPTVTAAVADIDGNLRDVTIDLTSLGGSQSQRMYDDGKNGGDLVADDGTYTYVVRKQSFPLGAKTVTIYAEDGKGSQVQSSITIEVKDAVEFSEAPIIVRSGVTPYEVPNDGFTSAILWAIVQDKEGDIDKVYADLTPLGGTGKVDLDDAGSENGNYSVQIQVLPTTPLGRMDLDIFVEDDVGHEVSGKVALMVVLPPADPLIIGTDVEPSEVPNDGKTQVLITAAVSDPNEDIVSVSADLSKVGGQTSVPMTDDGKGADPRASDGIWSLRLTVPSTVVSGSKDIEIRVTDSTGRYATTEVGLRVVQGNKPPTIQDYNTGLTEGRAGIGDEIVVKVNASDPEGRALRVELDLTELSLGIVELRDDGEGKDEEGGDGVFTGSFILTGNLSGNYNITIRVVDDRNDVDSVLFQVFVEGEADEDDIELDLTVIAIAGGLLLVLVLAAVFAYVRTSRSRSGAPRATGGAPPQPVFRPMNQPPPNRFAPVGGAGPR